ncbi:winged helix-turn-helix transcriptional regulator [Pedobacter sp. 22163]|uniref:winged helix-turn-helix transcriptional regulator n=1 Tax=Pedobacter sp. 22163 TaxID=3453883 RepID=UPI003F846485
MYTKKIKENLDCGILVAAKAFGGKWKLCILDAIKRGMVRPADICRYISDASPRVIEMQLAELLFFGVIEKCAEDIYPKKTEYKLTLLGESILPIMTQMDNWGTAHSEFIKERHKELEESEST